jgi:hypothetical protein
MPGYHFDIVSALDIKDCPNVPVFVTEAQGFELENLYPGLIAFIPFEVSLAININNHYYMDVSLAFGLEADTYWSAITKDQFTALTKQRPDLAHTLLGGLSSSSRANTERAAKRAVVMRPKADRVAPVESPKPEEPVVNLARHDEQYLRDLQKCMYSVNVIMLSAAKATGICTNQYVYSYTRTTLSYAEVEKYVNEHKPVFTYRAAELRERGAGEGRHRDPDSVLDALKLAADISYYEGLCNPPEWIYDTDTQVFTRTPNQYKTDENGKSIPPRNFKTWFTVLTTLWDSSKSVSVEEFKAVIKGRCQFNADGEELEYACDQKIAKYVLNKKGKAYIYDYETYERLVKEPQND